MTPTLKEISHCWEDESWIQIIENKVVFEKYHRNGTKQDKISINLFFYIWYIITNTEGYF